MFFFTDLWSDKIRFFKISLVKKIIINESLKNNKKDEF